MEKTSSLIYSAGLHSFLLFLILFWPVNTVFDIEKESYQVSLVTGKMGENIALGRTARPQPVPQKTPTPTPAPQPKPEAKPVEIPKEEAKPVETKPEEKKQPEKTQEEAPSSPQPSSAALSALAELEQLMQSDLDTEETGSTGLEVAQNEGGGIYDVYISTVMLVVRNEWSIPIYTRETYVAEVYVELDMAGNIIHKSIERGSGRADFDASALNALERLGKLPAPPSPELQNLVLVFNSAQ